MNLDDRISRRLRDGESGPVTDGRALSPADHLEQPVDRGPVLERLLDCLEPVLDGEPSVDTYVWGPRGGGKTAVVTALLEHLQRQVAPPPRSIVTSTRGASGGRTTFAYVDARTTTTDFQLYRRVLAGVSGEAVPAGGVSTADLRDRLVDTLAQPGTAAVVAVDHVGEPEILTVDVVADAFAPMGRIAWLCVGRDPPDVVPNGFDRTVEVPAYEEHSLEDVLSTRASNGLAANALSHAQVRRVATWAEGNAHDGLAVLFAAAEHARERGADSIDEPDLTAGTEAVPRGGVPVGRLLALPANRQAVLRALVDVDAESPASVDSTARTVADRLGVDLSAGTVRRFLYELADRGVLELVTIEATETDTGRPPSRVEPRFPAPVFRRLYDLDGSRWA